MSIATRPSITPEQLASYTCNDIEFLRSMAEFVGIAGKGFGGDAWEARLRSIAIKLERATADFDGLAPLATPRSI